MNIVSKTLLSILLKLTKIISMFVLWIVLVGVMITAINWFNTQSYQPSDVPDDFFLVLLNTPDGSEQAQTWKIAKTQPQAWVRVGNKHCKQEDCLYSKADGSLIFHNEGALWNSKSRYRIDGNKIIPISFLFFTFFHTFIAIILTFVVIGLGKYLFNRYRLRHSVEQTAIYNRQILNSFKTVTIILVAILLFYAFMAFV